MSPTKIIIILLVILALLSLYFFNLKSNIPTSSDTAVEQIIFPKGNEELTKGETYALKWVGGGNPIQIFLIDTALKPQGASVSVADRIYNVENKGTYEYVVPQTVPNGVYEFQIGNRTSATFQIVSP